ncbi:MAG: hypothetical protein U0869_05310 [Chloroflexota bacterium]
MQPTIGAQRAPATPRPLRLVTLLLALVGALGAIGSLPVEAAAARPKVVVVVGPVGSRTKEFRADAKRIARQARAYGARVTQVYSPWATWAKVQRVSRGANLLVYLGHGNGWPSPYGPYQPYTKNGLGLNSRPGAGNAAVSYKGEYYLKRQLHLAPNAVVLLNHLCYASGNAEGGAPTARRAVAKARADNYAKGFQEAGARAVFAIGIEHPSYILRGLFRTNRTMRQIFWSAPGARPGDRVVFHPRRSAGRAILDPVRGRFYFRSLVGDVQMRASRWR